MLKQVALEKGLREEDVSEEDVEIDQKPVQLYITKSMDKETKQEIISGIEKINYTDLDIKLIIADDSEGK